MSIRQGSADRMQLSAYKSDRESIFSSEWSRTSLVLKRLNTQLKCLEKNATITDWKNIVNVKRAIIGSLRNQDDDAEDNVA